MNENISWSNKLKSLSLSTKEIQMLLGCTNLETVRRWLREDSIPGPKYQNKILELEKRFATIANHK